MVKNWQEKLERHEYLRIKKIGNNFFAYARWTEYMGQKERYLGRCDKDGNVVSKRCRMRKKGRSKIN